MKMGMSKYQLDFNIVIKNLKKNLGYLKKFCSTKPTIHSLVCPSLCVTSGYLRYLRPQRTSIGTTSNWSRSWSGPGSGSTDLWTAEFSIDFSVLSSDSWCTNRECRWRRFAKDSRQPWWWVRFPNWAVNLCELVVSGNTYPVCKVVYFS